MGCITGGMDGETVFLGRPGIHCHLLSKVSICFLRDGERCAAGEDGSTVADARELRVLGAILNRVEV